MTDRVWQYIEAHKDNLLEDLKASCRLPSISGQAADLESMALWLKNRLQQVGCKAELWPVDGGPPIVWGTTGGGDRSILSYSHYDVQPPDPLDLWETPPFEPTVRDGKLYARGAADDKGDLLARIQAVEIYQALYGQLPLQVKFFVEGEEEIGSPNLDPVAALHAGELRSDGCLWESGEFDSHERYTIYLGVKGIQYVELRARGAKHDLHSAYAPVAPNPAWRLVQALNTLKAADDAITIDGFTDHVRAVTPQEEAFLDSIPYDGDALKRNWGIDAFINNMDDREALRAFLYAPTCTICGIRSGFIDEGQKTVLPSDASVKIDFRLVPDLYPALVLELLRAHLDRRGFNDIEIVPRSACPTSRSRPDADIVQAVIKTAEHVYGHEPVVFPSHGGSGPMYPLVQGLDMDGVTVGVGYVGTNMHAPNENIRLDDYFRNIVFLVELFRRFARD